MATPPRTRSANVEVPLREDLYRFDGETVTWISEEPITLASFIVRRADALRISRRDCIDLYRRHVDYERWDSVKGSADQAASRNGLRLKENEAAAIAGQIGRVTGMHRY